MKTASDELFQLVHSLSSSEKRHYMIRSKRNVSDRAQAKEIIYSAIEDQQTYNEAAIKAKLKRKDLASFPAVKKELYEDIVDSLRVYHAKRTPASELNALMENAYLLFHKGLFAAAEKRLARARKIATDYLLYSRLLEINSLERSIYSETVSAGLADKLRERYEEHKRLLAIMTNINDYTEIYNQVLLLVKRERVLRTPEQVKELDRLMKSTLLRDETRALSFNAQLIYLTTHMFSAFLREEYDRAYQLTKKQLHYWERYPHLIESNATRYIQGVNNLMNIASKINDYSDIPNYVKRLKKINPSSEYVRAILLDNIHSIEHGLALGTGDIDRAKKIILDGEKIFDQYGQWLNEVRILLFQLNGAITFFIAGDYERAIHYIQEAMTHSQMELRQDLQSFARLLLLLVHYELRNNKLLQYILRSTKRYLKAHDQNFKFEQILVASLKRLSSARNAAEEQKELLKLKNQVIGLLSDPYESRALHSFDFLVWIESKLEGRPLHEVWGPPRPAEKAA